MQIHPIALYLIFHTFHCKMMDIGHDLSQMGLTQITTLRHWMDPTRHGLGPDNTRLHGLLENPARKSILFHPQILTNARKISLDPPRKLSANLSLALLSNQ
jgi:hypothetical protein